MNNKPVSWSSARKICIIQTLAKSGHYPTRKSEKEAWFLSPLRSETQASFNVSLVKNKWYDFGIGKGGNIIDLVMAINNCSAYEAVQSLHENVHFSFCPEKISKKRKSSVEIKKVNHIKHPALLEYLELRKIPLEVAQRYCREVWYRLNNRLYFSIGLKNDAGGWELRNKFFKCSTSPKYFTYLKKNCKTLLVTEGMFDFLSLTVMQEELVNTSDVIVLNSLSFIKSIHDHLSSYDNIHLYLDNDSAGDKAPEVVLKRFDTVTDKRNSYREFKDLNEKLVNKNDIMLLEQKPQLIVP